MDLPVAARQAYRAAWLQQARDGKARALLARGGIAEGGFVPVAHLLGLAWCDKGLHLWISLL